MKRVHVWVLAFVLVIFITQIGSLEFQHSHMDESTYIVMAAHVLDGNLPNVEFFDLKPPMFFLLLAGAMAVAGESLLVVRAVGDICLLLSCAGVFAIARRQTGLVPAGLGVLVLIAVHAEVNAQWTRAVLSTAAMLMAALWLLIARRDRSWAIATAGFLLSLATLTRTNLWVLPAVFWVWLAVAATAQPALGVRGRGVVLFGAAGLLPLGLLVLIYWQADALSKFFLTYVAVAISYTGQMDMGETFLRHAHIFHEAHVGAPLLYWPFFAMVVTGLASSILRLGAYPTAHRPSPGRSAPEGGHELLWLAFSATLLSMLINGRAYDYHWLQVFPLCAVFCAHGIAWMHSRARLRWAGYLLPAIALAGALAQTVPSAIRLATVPGHLSKRPHVRVMASAIAAARRPYDTIHAFHDHLIYWYLDMMSPSPIIMSGVPLNAAIISPLAATGYNNIREDELGRILALRPTWLIMRETTEDVPRPWKFYGEDADVLRDILARDYSLFYKCPDARGRYNRVVYRYEDRSESRAPVARCQE